MKIKVLTATILATSLSLLSLLSLTSANTMASPFDPCSDGFTSIKNAALNYALNKHKGADADTFNGYMYDSKGSQSLYNYEIVVNDKVIESAVVVHHCSTADLYLAKQ